MELLLLLLLLGSAFIVYRSWSQGPSEPLNVDRGLSWPWAGHASTIFSLNALFGAYVIILIAIGPVAVAGVAIGGILGLSFLYMHFREPKSKEPRPFEQVLIESHFSTKPTLSRLLWSLTATVQILYATAELVVLKDIAQHLLPMPSRYAVAFALSVALVAYLYSTLGGWKGVYLTDIFQLFFVLAMCVTFLIDSLPVLLHPLESGASITSDTTVNSWDLPFSTAETFRLLWHFGVGLVMGLGFILASPDAWKRIYTLRNFPKDKRQRDSWIGLIKIAAAGLAPFLLLLPPVLLIPKPNLLNPALFDFVPFLIKNPRLQLALALGLVASFLSSFDSALLSATHISIAKLRGNGEKSYNLATFHYVIGFSFLSMALAFLAGISLCDNPYALGLALMGLYGVVGGAVIGTNAWRSPLRREWTMWIYLVIISAWSVRFFSTVNVLRSPLPEHLSLVPSAAMVFVLSALSSRALR